MYQPLKALEHCELADSLGIETFANSLGLNEVCLVIR